MGLENNMDMFSFCKSAIMTKSKCYMKEGCHTEHEFEPQSVKTSLYDEVIKI